MKIMYIGKDEILLNKVRHIFHQEQFDYIHYRDPGKALNNIREIDPDALFFMEDHFSGAAKTVRKVLTNTSIPQKSTILFFSNTQNCDHYQPPYYYLNSALSTNENIDFLNNAVNGKQNIENNIQLIFTHPISLNFITGKIEKIEKEIIEFTPDFPDSSASIVDHTQIPCCTLKIGKNFTTFSTELTFCDNNMHFIIDKKIMKKIEKLN